ncbi:CurL C-terminal domain-containing protein [Pseudonocardia humida]|uniref:Type I polyketide synthase n=1 Tax=Pseudonocardia humida TaxID=2800819 RepID=A0ABT1A1Z6_9PSEU|nr:ketoacyl-synthetase C-terminal extension domain-containing protein [Pseudonocardia humida]MCO1656976.1 type I polyketide synthase [Pseudonocardia humida]
MHAVLRGTAVNNDGRAKVGFGAPGVRGQAEVVRTAHLVAGVRPDEIGYVEAHGTATPFGDPIEVAALTEAFGPDAGPCRIGSVKSNIGHADAAAGIVGLIKTVLCVEHGALPASLHFTEPNPEIDFASSPFVVNDRTRPWTTDGRPRIAGTHATGVGGTNAHAVVAQAPPAPEPGPARPVQLLALSARTPSALDRTALRLAEHLERHPDAVLADVAWTLQTGRTAHPLRRFVVAAEAAEAVTALRGEHPALPVSTAADAGLLFEFDDDPWPPPGAGAQLHATEPAFRAALDEVAQTAVPVLGADLRDALLSPAPALTASIGPVAVFALEYATAALLTSWGAAPAAVAGRGVGAHTAACLAGASTPAAAVRLLAAPDRPAADPWAAPPGHRYLPVTVGPGRTGPDGSAAAGARALATAAGRLWAAGAPVDFAAMHSGERRRRVRLPTYPFERTTHLLTPDPADRTADGPPARSG